MKPSITIITTCKGRLPHLRESLPTFLLQRISRPFEVIVVDYCCPDGAFLWCKSLNLYCLTAIKVLDNAKLFNLNRARNIGAVHAKGEVLVFIDADIVLTPEFLREATSPIFGGKADLTACLTTLDDMGVGGTCAVSSKLFKKVEGYDEGFIHGWGHDDTDFYGRCKRLTKWWPFKRKFLQPINHSDELRTKHYKIKNKSESAERHRAYMKKRKTVNPDGYGLGKFEIFTGAGQCYPFATWPEKAKKQNERTNQP